MTFCGKGGAVFVRDIMTRDVVSVEPTATLHEAAMPMSERHRDGLPVVDKNGRLAVPVEG